MYRETSTTEVPMRAALLALFVFAAPPVWCGEDILDVLDRSQHQQLDALELADPGSPEAQRV